MPLSPRTLRPSSSFTPRSISGLALWLDASQAGDLYTTDAGPVTAVSSPTEISGCALWLDGADSSAASMTVNGSLVETWKDKSGNGRDFTASGSARPTLTASAINSLSAVTFNGSSTTMSGNAAAQEVIRNLSGYTVFTVLRTASVAAGERLAFGVGATVLFRVGQQDSRPFVGGRRVLADALESITDSSGTITTGAAFIQSAVVNHTSQSLAGVRNGATFATDATYMGAGSSENSASAASVGTQGGGTYGFWNGEIAEIVVFNTALSTADRARVEAYLAQRWGISGVHAAATSASDPVGYWRDRSGNGRHATQATGGNRPTVSATAVNARRAIGFNGTASRLALPSMDSTPSTVIAVARHNPGTSSAGRTPLCIMEGANYMSWQFQQTGTIRAGVTYNAAQLHFTASGLDPQGSVLLITGQMSAGGGGLLGRLNGAALPGTDTVAYADGGQSRIGCRFRTTDDQFWSGEVCEVLHYQSALSLSQVQRLERYLASRWGITLAPQVSNADAQDWVNRVYANGGTVSASTASAVNSLCVDLENAGLRDRFYRLNLFCGTGLNACLVPLYRGPSLGGTQYGNATDTNVGPFVSGDYVELGASGGLLGNGSSKYLNTGLAPSALPSVATGHMAAYSPQITPVDSTRAFMGCASGSAQYNLSYSLNTGTGLARLRTTWGGTSGHDANEPSGVFRGGLRLSTRTSATALRTYHNSTQVSLFETSVTPVAHTNNWFVFAFSSAGTPIQYSPDSMRAYSIGESMSAEQVAAYYTAMQAFQTALGRNV